MIRTRIRFLPSLNQALFLGNRGTVVHRIRNQCRIPPTKNHLQVKPLMIPEPLFSRREFRSETTESRRESIAFKRITKESEMFFSPPSLSLPFSLESISGKDFSRKLGEREERLEIEKKRERETETERKKVTALNSVGADVK